MMMVIIFNAATEEVVPKVIPDVPNPLAVDRVIKKAVECLEREGHNRADLRIVEVVDGDGERVLRNEKIIYASTLN
jgi:hypothetical protein